MIETEEELQEKINSDLLHEREIKLYNEGLQNKLKEAIVLQVEKQKRIDRAIKERKKNGY